MITSRLAFAAEGVTLDAVTRAMSAYNILDDIHAVGFPLLLQRVFFAAKLVRDTAVDPAALDCQLRLSLDDTVLLDNAPVHISFEDKARVNIAVQIQGLLIMQPGTLRFRLRLREQELAGYEVSVGPTPAPQPQVLQAPVPNPVPG